jgi:hypothetical protein
MEKATNVMLPAFAMEVNPCMWDREHDAQVGAEMKAVAPKVRAAIGPGQMMTMSKDIKEVTRVNLIKNISPRRPTRGTTNLALQFPSCFLDATSTLRDGAHSMNIMKACSCDEGENMRSSVSVKTTSYF